MKKYLTDLITEKGREVSDEIKIDGHFGITYEMLIDYIVEARDYHAQIKNTLTMIDFKNGDVFHYLQFLAVGMVKACGY